MIDQVELTNCLALDCEMVGVGTDPNVREDMLARVSLVNEKLECVYDTFVRPTQAVTDYRTDVSGVTEAQLVSGQDFHVVQQKVEEMLTGRILVGHSVHHDLAALDIPHPVSDTRDTSEFLPFKWSNNNKRPSLKLLAQKELNLIIQEGAHDSVEDAAVVMRVYQSVASEWESWLNNYNLFLTLISIFLWYNQSL